MMRKSHELVISSSSSNSASTSLKHPRSTSPGFNENSISNSNLDEQAIFDQEMELDNNEYEDDLDDGNADPDGNADDGDDGMDTSETAETTARFNELLTEAVQYGQQLRMDYHNSGDDGLDLKMLDEVFSLVCYSDPKGSLHGHYLNPEGRVAVAEELNSAILGEPLPLSPAPFSNILFCSVCGYFWCCFW